MCSVVTAERYFILSLTFDMNCSIFGLILITKQDLNVILNLSRRYLAYGGTLCTNDVVQKFDADSGSVQ